MTDLNARSKFHSVFLISVATGAVGLAISDTWFGGSNGGLGFLVGFLGGFILLSLLVVISDFGGASIENKKTVFTDSLLSDAVTQSQSTLDAWKQSIEHTAESNTGQ